MVPYVFYFNHIRVQPFFLLQYPPPSSMNVSSMNIKIGVFYINYARTSRTYFTLDVDSTYDLPSPQITIKVLRQSINAYNKSTATKESGDFSKMTTNEPLSPDTRTLKACGIADGQSVIAIQTNTINPIFRIMPVDSPGDGSPDIFLSSLPKQ
ncbi:hypothetical protein SCP_0900910 [Sparassis crispa]|uniref:Uncharacterized protein n=1 Tax=Sparassis crispa TaxID=139825 RepID=A0A401GVK0_9APHY|nr:hypothetical protein SCP_0900910 [Sparassis crispa]GBE86212.1 hypothetical protein SCP_0900910 [Sparassis crispa]